MSGTSEMRERSEKEGRKRERENKIDDIDEKEDAL